MNTLAAGLLAILFLAACASDKERSKMESTGVPLWVGPETKTIEVDFKPYQVQWIEYEMDFLSMIKGERGMLSATLDPWAKIPTPPGAVATIAGFVLLSEDGQMDMTGKIVSWENHDLQLGGGSNNLPYRAPHEIPNWRLPFDRPFRMSNALAGTRIRTVPKERDREVGTTSTEKVANQSDSVLPNKVEAAPPPFEEFADGERYVFCLKRDSGGEITKWIGDVLAVIHIVPVYRAAPPNPVLAITPDNLQKLQSVETGKSANKVVFELSKAGKEFSWRDNNRQGSFKASNRSVQMLIYALNMIVWEKRPWASDEAGATMPWHYVIQYREGGSTKSATFSPLANGREIILESAELGRWKGEIPVLIAAAFQELGKSR